MSGTSFACKRLSDFVITTTYRNGELDQIDVLGCFAGGEPMTLLPKQARDLSRQLFEIAGGRTDESGRSETVLEALKGQQEALRALVELSTDLESRVSALESSSRHESLRLDRVAEATPAGSVRVCGGEMDTTGHCRVCRSELHSGKCNSLIPTHWSPEPEEPKA